MSSTKIAVVEDNAEYRKAIVEALQEHFPKHVAIEIDAFDPTELKFEEALTRLKDSHIVLLDNQFGAGCAFHGANLAPSLGLGVISMSSDRQPWARLQFESKSRLAGSPVMSKILVDIVLAGLLQANLGPGYVLGKLLGTKLSAAP